MGLPRAACGREEPWALVSLASPCSGSRVLSDDGPWSLLWHRSRRTKLNKLEPCWRPAEERLCPAPVRLKGWGSRSLWLPGQLIQQPG